MEKRRRILLIEDEDDLRQTLMGVLTGWGHDVTPAGDGVVGSRLLADQLFDLLITDIVLPEQDGIEIIITARRRDPVMPILAMTGGGRGRNMDFLRLAQDVGANMVIRKPFRIAELRAAIDSLMPSPAPDGAG